jgi:hypothetical protein
MRMTLIPRLLAPVLPCAASTLQLLAVRLPTRASLPLPPLTCLPTAYHSLYPPLPISFLLPSTHRQVVVARNVPR